MVSKGPDRPENPKSRSRVLKEQAVWTGRTFPLMVGLR